MKPFITEQEMLELKYQKNGKYYGKCLAEIFLLEFNEYVNRTNNYNLFEVMKRFYYQILEEQCSVKFEDNSILLIEQNEKKEWVLFKVYDPKYLHIHIDCEYRKGKS